MPRGLRALRIPHGSSGARLVTVRTVDDTDRRILLELVEQPRATNAAIAERLGLARNTVQTRVAALEASDALQGFDRRLHAAALGYPLTVFMAVHIDQHRIETAVAQLERIPEVVQAFGLSGQADVLVRAVCRDAEDLYRVNKLVLACEGIDRTETWLSMGELIPFRLAPVLERDLAARHAR